MILNRRHLRIKVLQTLYSYSLQEDVDGAWAEKELFKAIHQIYDLYILLLNIFPELKIKAEQRIEQNKGKMLLTEEDTNPNLKFVDNQIIRALERSVTLKQKSKELQENWETVEKQEIIRKMFNHILQSEVYFQFMNSEERSFEEDKEFMVQLFKSEIANFPFLHHFLEERSIYWWDDVDLVCSMVLRTIKNFQPVEESAVVEKGAGDALLESEALDKEMDWISEIFPLYKADDDERKFITTLLEQTIKLRPSNLQLIDQLTKNWELDRIAKMDVLLMELAITELITFSNIPTKVTLNEYIEISKFYSTPKSSVFINGIIDKAITQLKEEGKIMKEGKGLTE